MPPSPFPVMSLCPYAVASARPRCRNPRPLMRARRRRRAPPGAGTEAVTMPALRSTTLFKQASPRAASSPRADRTRARESRTNSEGGRDATPVRRKTGTAGCSALPGPGAGDRHPTGRDGAPEGADLHPSNRGVALYGGYQLVDNRHRCLLSPFMTPRGFLKRGSRGRLRPPWRGLRCPQVESLMQRSIIHPVTELGPHCPSYRAFL